MNRGGLRVVPEMQRGVKEAFIKLFVAPEGLKVKFSQLYPWDEWWVSYKKNEMRYRVLFD